jgi:hypothetical protein
VPVRGADVARLVALAALYLPASYSVIVANVLARSLLCSASARTRGGALIIGRIGA